MTKKKVLYVRIETPEGVMEVTKGHYIHGLNGKQGHYIFGKVLGFCYHVVTYCEVCNTAIDSGCKCGKYQQE